jgi:polysaccharide pyruvyl transferase WcaK-like protein
MKIGIIGWYGYNNLGDEVILHVILKQLLTKVTIEDIVVFSEKPSVVEQVHNIRSVLIGYEGKLGNFISELEKIDFLIFGGGGFISDWQPEAMPNTFKIACMAKAFGKKIIFYSVGVGPILTDNGKILIKKMCDLSDLITVRDQNCYDLLTGIGVKNVFTTSDPAVIFDEIDDKAGKYLIQDLNTDRPIVGIYISYFMHNDKYWPNKFDEFLKYKKTMIKLVYYLYHQLRLQPVFIPVFPVDEDFAKEIVKEGNLEYEIPILRFSSDYRLVTGILAHTIMVIGTRLHALILSSISRVPVIGIIVHPKSEQYLKSIGLDKLAVALGDGAMYPESRIDFEKLKESVQYILENREHICEHMMSKILLLKSKQEINFRLLLETLQIH